LIQKIPKVLETATGLGMADDDSEEFDKIVKSLKKING
jgi:hypothetical protein